MRVSSMRKSTPHAAPPAGNDDRRKSTRRVRVADRREEDIVRSLDGDRRQEDRRGLALSMIDALHDILEYERHQRAS